MLSMSTAFETYGIGEIRSLIGELSQPAFRAKQVIGWVYNKGVTSFDDMTNVPRVLREALAEQAPLHVPEIVDKQVSVDGARKYVLALADGARVETVGIPSRDAGSKGSPRRLTVCFSTQVGCPMGCAFCATGEEGFTRNLLPGEMAQQVLTVQRDFGARVSNVVAMGQGEPFLNYDNVLEALRIMNSDQALGIGARHITVSTCGVLKGIDAFAHEPEQFTLALSLHSAIQSTRDRIMPKCAGTSLADLKDALDSYYRVSTRRPSIEYLMMKGINDGEKDLAALLDFCDGLFVHVNLLPMNEIEGSPFHPSRSTVVDHWVRTLTRNGIEANVRDSRGSDIDGACGQLKNRLG